MIEALVGSLSVEVIPTVGAVLSTLQIALGPAAKAELPALSEAVSATMDILKVPSPVIPLIVTTRSEVPEPLTATVPAAVPVVLRMIFPSAKVTLSALL